MSALVHPTARVETDRIGPMTRIGAGAAIARGASVGARCDIGDGARIDHGARIGDGVVVGAGVRVAPGATVEQDAAIAGSSGAGQPSIVIWHGATVTAGSRVMNSVPPRAVASGHPAAVTGFATTAPCAPLRQLLPAGTRSASLGIRGATAHALQAIGDDRGSMFVAEFGSHVPGAVERCFLIRDVPAHLVRGQHAHRRCHQHFVMTMGSCSLVLDDGTHAQELVLDTPETTVHLGPLVWATLHRFSPDAALAVFASEHYDERDYVRRYDDFLELAARRG